MSRFLLLLLACLIAPVAALAADAAPSTIVDLQPILTLVLQALGAILLGVGTWGITWISNYFKLAQDSTIRDYLDDALKNGVSYAMGKLGVLTVDLGKVDVKSAVIAEAASYAAAHVPDALKFFGLDADPDALARLVTARLPSLDTAAAASAAAVATPAPAAA
jgi:hypothetical protein